MLNYQEIIPKLSTIKIAMAPITLAILVGFIFDWLNFPVDWLLGPMTAGIIYAITPTGKWAKVNPPIRPREVLEYLWQAVLNRQIHWIVSDHVCCSAEKKASSQNPQNIWLAKSGFGGTEYLLSGVFSEGKKKRNV